jgi:hypothetical protein
MSISSVHHLVPINCKTWTLPEDVALSHVALSHVALSPVAPAIRRSPSIVTSTEKTQRDLKPLSQTGAHRPMTLPMVGSLSYRTGVDPPNFQKSLGELLFGLGAPTATRGTPTSLPYQRQPTTAAPLTLRFVVSIRPNHFCVVKNV